ncbi:hypothetical protein [Halomicrococcus sp. NG-SE-24]|uniref:hypothetical protein n=1 Tax=Halomicrococcus sp. NG-SE-24 TaxID=3436928 RepID=UPI003D9596C9
MRTRPVHRHRLRRLWPRRALRSPGGAALTKNAPGDRLWNGPSGIVCNGTNEGTMMFHDCVLRGCPDNGLYAAHGTGAIRVEGGLFQNNLGTNVRLRGHDSYIKNATVVVDGEDSGWAQRGVHLKAGNLLVVDNVDFQTNLRESPIIWITDGAEYNYIVNSTITVQSDEPTATVSVRSSAGKTRIKCTDIDHDAGGGPAVKIKEGKDNGPVFLEHVTVTGEAPENGTRGAIYNARDNCEFRDVNVDHSSNEGRHALINRGANCLVYQGNYVSPDVPIVDHGDDTWIKDVSARSRNGRAGLHLTDDAEDIYVKESDIENGIRDDSADGYSGYNNSL